MRGDVPPRGLLERIDARRHWRVSDRSRLGFSRLRAARVRDLPAICLLERSHDCGLAVWQALGDPDISNDATLFTADDPIIGG